MIMLRRGAERRVRRGHCWIFSNEIAEPPVRTLEPGALHELVDHAGRFIATVYVNPKSLITARVLCRQKRGIDRSFFEERLRKAIAWRKRVLPHRDACRLVFSEADGIPGLVVDRYGSVLVLQSLTAGIDRFMEELLSIIVALMAPKGVFVRNDSPFREMEGVPLHKYLAYGDVPDVVEISSGGLRFLVDIVNGQKTGFFLDQESNRDLMRKYVEQDSMILDLFSYTGAWGMHALAAGAGEVTAVDSSKRALQLAAIVAELNGFFDRFKAINQNAIEFLKQHQTSWDMVILDPPAFIKNRAGISHGIKGYIDINRRVLGHLKKGGILVTCSCSHHLDIPTFEKVLTSASVQSGRTLRLLESRGQGPDHPMLLAMPETRYLKLLVAQVV